MKEIKIIFTLPILASDCEYPRAYIDGYFAGTMDPIRAEIESGTLNIDKMLDAGWEINIPESVGWEINIPKQVEPVQAFTGGIGGPLVPGEISLQGSARGYDD